VPARRLAPLAFGMFGLLASGLSVSACTPTPLPEEGTAAQILYAERCGGCHAVFQPSMLTGRMWDTMVSRMEVTMRRRGVPLAEADRTEILAYLQRNAGKQ